MKEKKGLFWGHLLGEEKKGKKGFYLKDCLASSFSLGDGEGLCDTLMTLLQVLDPKIPDWLRLIQITFERLQL